MFLHVRESECVSCACMSKYVASGCSHSSFYSERHDSAAGKWQVRVPSHPGVSVLPSCTKMSALDTWHRRSASLYTKVFKYLDGRGCLLLHQC